MEKSPLLLKRLDKIRNINRRKIYWICLREKLNITELSKRIGLSYNSTFENLKILEDCELIKKEKDLKDTEATISSIPLDTEYSLTYKYLEILEEEEPSGEFKKDGISKTAKEDSRV